MSCNDVSVSDNSSEDDDVPIRIPCIICHRKFNPDSLRKHSKVCEKLLHKKRVVFDSAKQRIQGTGLAEFLPAVSQKSQEITLAIKSPSNWKENHMALINIIKAARNEPTISESHEKFRRNRSRSSSLNRSTVLNQQKCIYCDRSFGLKSYDRHLEWCKEKASRINLPTASIQEAKERLDARIKYRAPSFRSRRSIMRDKYAPKSQKDHEGLENNSSDIISNKLSASTSSLKSNNDEKSEIFTPTTKRRNFSEKWMNDIQNMKKFTRESSHQNIFKKSDKSESGVGHEVNFIRQNVLRCSYRSRAAKKPQEGKDLRVRSNSITRIPYKDEAYKRNDNATNTISKTTTTKPKSKYSTTNNNNSSVPNYSRYNSRVSSSNYDPYLSAEIQMQELLNDDIMNTSTEDICNTTFTISSPILSSRNISEEQIEKNGKENNYSSRLFDREIDEKSELMCSSLDASAFSNNNNYPDKSFEKIDDNNRYFPPIMTRSDIYDSHMIERNPLVSLSNLSMCTSVTSTTVDIPEEDEVEKPKIVRSAETNRSNKILTTIPVMQRSISLHSGEPRSKKISSKFGFEKERSFCNKMNSSLDEKFSSNSSKFASKKERSFCGSRSSNLKTSSCSNENSSSSKNSNNYKNHQENLKNDDDSKNYGGAYKNLKDNLSNFETTYDSYGNLGEENNYENLNSQGNLMAKYENADMLLDSSDSIEGCENSENYEDDLEKSVHSYENMERNFFRSVSDLERALEISNLEREIGIFSNSPESSNSSDSYKNIFSADSSKYDVKSSSSSSVVNNENNGQHRDMGASKISIDSAYNREFNFYFDQLYNLHNNSNLPINNLDMLMNTDSMTTDTQNNQFSANWSLNRCSPVFEHARKLSTKLPIPHFDYDDSSAKLSTTGTSSPSMSEKRTDDQRLSKFCHECGAKYPVSVAKFCCECGVRRLVL